MTAIHPELQVAADAIMSAPAPHFVFGDVADARALTKRYRSLSRAVHPDHNEGDALAVAAFQRLNELFQQGLTLMVDGKYGQTSVSITTKRHEYSVYEIIGTQGVADVYSCFIDEKTSGELHVARSPRDNDLMLNEAKTLRTLLADSNTSGYQMMLPRFVENLTYRDGGIDRSANAFEAYGSGMFVTLDEAMQLYPDGVDARDMAWIYRRLLDILGYAHSLCVVHGAVVPANILIGLGDVHEVILINWQNSVHAAEHKHIPAIDNRYKSYYPPEVLNKEKPFSGTDIYMASMCMDRFTSPAAPKRIQGFLKACSLKPSSSRTQSAWAVRKDFSSLIDATWGRREYRPFRLPN